MHSYFRFLSGYVRIRIQGYGATRFVNICSKRGIAIWDLERSDEEFLLNISIRGFRHIPEIVRKTKVKAVIVEKHGLPFFFAKMSYRKCFFIGACLCFFWLLYMKNFVWAIEINGNVGITDDRILDFLVENQIEIGSKISDLNEVELERLFREKFPDITWITIGQNGTVLTIDLREREIPLYEEEPLSASSLYAPCGGEIVSMVVRRGNPAVKINDVVEQGELLVDGILPVVKTDGTILGYNLVNADADIALRYTNPYYDEISFYSQEKVYTEESYKEYYLTLGKKTFAFHFFPKEYENTETTQNFIQLKLWENFYLPVWFGIGEHKEYHFMRVKAEQKDLEAILYERLDLFLESLEEKGVQNIQKDVKISIGGSVLILSGELTITDSAMQREEISAPLGTELENDQYNSVVNGNEH